MNQVYQTLVARALHVCQHQRVTSPSNRVIIALCGPPGSGKSTIAAEVVARLNTLAHSTVCHCSSYGWLSLSKKYLDSLPNHEEAYARRGAHWTFDATGVLHLVKALHLSKTNVQEVIKAPHFDHAVGDLWKGLLLFPPRYLS